MTREEILALLARYEAGNCSEQEKELLEKWLFTRFQANTWSWQDDTERRLVKQAIQANVEKQLFARKKSLVVTIQRIVVAALLLACCMIGAWIYFNRTSSDPIEHFYTTQAVTPGSNSARLTLADGKTIWLDDVQEGTLYDESGVAITKLTNGELHYKVDESAVDQAGNIRTNSISIPRGGQYQLTLPDGTKVWLNSATTLSYPVAFVEKERIVTLTGEAYFEVAKNEKQPFKVKANDTEVLVTGTHFNITAYSDESHVVTTLVEGGVKVSKNGQMVTLVPNQQAITTSTSNTIHNKQVDTEYALAWTQGDFLFEEQDIKAIMKNIARWYNIEVIFKGHSNPKKFGGTYTRSKGLEELLKHLESLSTIRFVQNERKVTVMM